MILGAEIFIASIPKPFIDAHASYRGAIFSEFQVRHESEMLIHIILVQFAPIIPWCVFFRKSHLLREFVKYTAEFHIEFSVLAECDAKNRVCLSLRLDLDHDATRIGGVHGR